MKLAEFREWESSLLWDDIYVVNRDSMSVYCKKRKLAEECTYFFNDILKEIHAPYSEEALKIIKLGEVDVRETLYYGKYRYRVELSKTYGYDDSKLKSTLNRLAKAKGTRFYSSRSGWTYIIYTNDKPQIAKLKLTLNEQFIRTIKTCKLFSEL